MKTIGFIISHKENELRRALIPEDLLSVKHREQVYIETGYGKKLGYSDEEYKNMGCHICPREEILEKDILCDPKIGDAEYLNKLHEKQLIFGWIHAVQNKDITDKILNAKASAIAWEDMFDKGRHVFWRNNEIAGEAAIMHAYSLSGIFPYDTKVALIGNGNVARGAYRILVSLGAEVVQYNRKSEQMLREELKDYDVIVNAVLWDTERKDHIIYRSDLQQMKRNALIIDVSCDRNGGIETSVPTTIENPIYFVDGIAHYVVDHTPSLFYKTISKSISKVCVSYIDLLIAEKYNDVLEKALIIKNGIIIDQRINKFQNRLI